MTTTAARGKEALSMSHLDPAQQAAAWDQPDPQYEQFMAKNEMVRELLTGSLEEMRARYNTFKKMAQQPDTTGVKITEQLAGQIQIPIRIYEPAGSTSQLQPAIVV